MLTVEIEPRELTGRGQRYNVYLSGELIVRGSLDPEYDAAEALRALGHSGPYEIVDAATDRPWMALNRQANHGPKEQQTIGDT